MLRYCTQSTAVISCTHFCTQNSILLAHFFKVLVYFTDSRIWVISPFPNLRKWLNTWLIQLKLDKTWEPNGNLEALWTHNICMTCGQAWVMSGGGVEFSRSCDWTFCILSSAKSCMEFDKVTMISLSNKCCTLEIKYFFSKLF